MNTASTVVNPNTPPPAAGASTAPQTNTTVTAAVGGKPSPNTPALGPVPYERFQEVVRGNQELRESVEQMQTQIAQLRSQPGDVPAQRTPSNGLPDYDTDPIGFLKSKIEHTEGMLRDLHAANKSSEGEKLVGRLKEANPIFGHPKWGADAMAVLQAKLSTADGSVPPARIVREVAERFSSLAVADSTAPIQTAAAAASHVGLTPSSTPAVGAAQMTPGKPKSFDEASRAAKASGRWEAIAQKFSGAAQI